MSGRSGPCVTNLWGRLWLGYGICLLAFKLLIVDPCPFEKLVVAFEYSLPERIIVIEETFSEFVE